MESENLSFLSGFLYQIARKQIFQKMYHLYIILFLISQFLKQNAGYGTQKNCLTDYILER